MTDHASSSEATKGTRRFVEPIISDAVEVVKGNPAAGVLFAVSTSFTATDGGGVVGGDATAFGVDGP